MVVAVFILTTATIANAALAVLVLWNKPKGNVNRLFALTALATAGWTGTSALVHATDSAAVALAAAEFSSAISLIMSASFLYFSRFFPLRTAARSRWQFYLLWALAAYCSSFPLPWIMPLICPVHTVPSPAPATI